MELFSAPGRSEVGGNHTDHQHGMVLAAAVNLDALAVAGKNGDRCIRLLSEGYEPVTVELSDLSVRESEKETTAALIRGVAAGLSRKGFPAGGFNLYVTSDVLIGAGLSSSAAFEVLVGTVISGLFHEMKIDPVEIAKQAQYAENVYFGKPCGLMDQTASSVGGLIHIDFKDPEEPGVSRLPVDFSSYHYSLCITDTKGSHADLTEDYADIPREMKAAAACLGKQVLREVDEAEFMKQLPQVRKACGDRAALRALHFFSENRRAALEAEALTAGDFPRFLKLVEESGIHLTNICKTFIPARRRRSRACPWALRSANGSWTATASAASTEADLPEPSRPSWRRPLWRNTEGAWITCSAPAPATCWQCGPWAA